MTLSQQFNSYNESGGRKKNKNSRARFWSSDLWVMGPATFHCATLLRVSLRSFFAAPISKSTVPRCLCESAKVGMIGTQGAFKVKWWWLTVALESRWYMEDLKPLSTLPFNNNFYKTVIHVLSTIPMQQVTATPSVLAFKQMWLISLCTKFRAWSQRNPWYQGQIRRFSN